MYENIIFDIFGPTKDWKKQVIVEKPRPNLGDLPLEIIDEIRVYLEPLDILCLAVCNKWLFSSFPVIQFYNFNFDEYFLFEFLVRLDKTEPRNYLCHSCKRLHSAISVPLPGPTKRPPNCHGIPASGTTYSGYHHLYMDQTLRFCHYPSYTPYQFSFVHLQLAMRSFKHGDNFGIPVECLGYTEIAICPVAETTNNPLTPSQHTQRLKELTLHEETRPNSVNVLFSVDARICAKNPHAPTLCLRTQELAMACRQKVWLISPDLWTDWVRICWHISTAGFESQDSHGIRHEIRELLRLFQLGERPEKLFLQGRCKKCNTSWKIQVREFGPNDVCLVVTRWINLGSGRTPKDLVWRSLVESKPLLPSEMMTDDPRMQFERDSVQARSEDALSDEGLFWKNADILQEKGYRHLMTEVGVGRWYAPFGAQFLIKELERKKNNNSGASSDCNIV
ncbi:hypothetical protein N7466_004957 [Penicillium verhagenii]|uniref:uncharacterized protein n=1 Tax=Penicillium verhagenii TaxID=1562060 RepID=UPI0025450D41|nr:uncharacterized protein N7466_004957 [Penicillium verhagenii]KAJ5935410.1 hypothetical protein N7466_004957 [Penicillium verhagenii]